jgi:hypothetical protein
MSASSGGGGIFLHHRTLTIDHTQVGGSTLTNFPVLVSLTLGAGKIQNVSCYDVILTSDSGGTAKVAWEPEASICNSTTGTFAAWVLISSISSSVDTVFYVFYDNVAIGSPQNTGSFSPANMWSAPGYLGVFHLPNGSILTANDSTANGFNGTLGATTHDPSATAGEIDGGALFAAASVQDISIPSGLDPTGTKTLSAWVYFTSHSGLQDFISLGGSAGNDGFAAWVFNNTILVTTHNSTADSKQSTVTPTDGTWHYFVATKTVQQATHIYWDGVDTTTADVIDHVGVPSNNYLGVYGDGISNPFNGALDEVRLFNGTLPAGWILAEYNNQKPSSSFLTLGAEI